MKKFASPSFTWLACAALLACVPGLTACGGEEAPPTPTDNTEAAATGSDTDSGVLSGDHKAYGADLTSSAVITVDDLIARRHEYKDQTVAVEGLVIGVCAKRGCWMEIGGSDGKAVRFKVNDGEIVIPMSAKGSKVVAEGVWTHVFHTVEQLREMEQKHADEAGEEFDPESITEPVDYWQLKGLGAKIDV
jgi:hypothetical protein